MRSIPSIRSLTFALVLLGISAASYAQVGISVTFAPPELPVYEQPLIPGEGYIWTPGYWAWSDDDGDYYWVPGTWVMAPEVGFLWTPLYWAWDNGAYVFYDGYWGCLNSGQMQQRLERFLIVVPDGNSAHFDFLGTEQNSCTFEKSTSR